jgi:Uncharacterized protein conserved in bacteria
VRRRFLTTSQRVSGKSQSFTDGTETDIRYKISRRSFRWLKKCGKTVLQKAYRQKGGYFIITRNRTGETVSKARYGANHRWLQTAYYSENTARPSALLKQEQGGGLVLLRYNSEKHKYIRNLLEPFPAEQGTAGKSLVNAVAGEPPVFCETDAGSFYYCLPAEKESRLAVENDLCPSGRCVQPDWPGEKEVPVNFNYILNDMRAAEPEQQKQPEIRQPEQPGLLPQAEDMPKSDYAADLEIFSTEEPLEKPTKYTVASKGLGGRAQISEKIAPHTERAAKRIVISAEESYLYFGKVIDGLREGRGRTQMQNGGTAYEGGYRNDKRNGFGVYYYKSGKVCYVGGWKENRRDGAGVSYSSRDGSIFVGKWKDNIPTGIGTAFDAEGNLIYTGEWKDGKRHGHGTEYKGGKIVFSGEFRDDRYYTGYQQVEPPKTTQ